MKVRLLAFAHASDALGFREREVDLIPGETGRALLTRETPLLSLQNIRLAVDREYCDVDAPIPTAEEIAIIPPVSGG